MSSDQEKKKYRKKSRSRSRSRTKKQHRSRSPKKSHKSKHSRHSRSRSHSNSNKRYNDHKSYRHNDHKQNKYSDKPREYNNRNQDRDKKYENNRYDQKYENNKYQNKKYDDNKSYKQRNRLKEQEEDEKAEAEYREKLKQQKQDGGLKKDDIIDKNEQNEEDGETLEQEVEKPNYEATGFLAELSNKVNGSVLKFTEPIDAAMPTERYKLFPYKGEKELDPISLRGYSCFLAGKDIKVAQILLQNPTCSQQHAVIQFKIKRTYDELSGEYTSQVLPYLMDLESTNGTFLNGEKIEGARYYQLLSTDVIKFGHSDRQYVFMKYD